MLSALVLLPLVNGSKAWLKYQADCGTPEQEPAPAVPGQPPP